MKKNYLTLNDEFIKYCEINNINDVEKFADKLFQRGFTIEKYGETPKGIKISSSENKLYEDEINKLKNEIAELKIKLEEKKGKEDKNIYDE